MEFSFGSGVLVGRRTDPAVQQSSLFGVLQEGDIEFSFNNKELMGQNQFPVAVARGAGKISGKAKFANIGAQIYNDLFFGQTVGTGRSYVANGETGIIPGTPFQITVANSVTFGEDLGVIDNLTQTPLVKVASAPATGQYSVNESTGVYTFAAADTTKTVIIYYRYTAAGGKNIVIQNILLGIQPFFEIITQTQWNNKKFMIKLNRCTSSKLSFPIKNEDFMIPEFDFAGQADDSNNIGTIWVEE